MSTNAMDTDLIDNFRKIITLIPFDSAKTLLMRADPQQIVELLTPTEATKILRDFVYPTSNVSVLATASRSHQTEVFEIIRTLVSIGADPTVWKHEEPHVLILADQLLSHLGKELINLVIRHPKVTVDWLDRVLTAPFLGDRPYLKKELQKRRDELAGVKEPITVQSLFIIAVKEGNLGGIGFLLSQGAQWTDDLKKEFNDKMC